MISIASMNKVLITSWGNPSSWREVTYEKVNKRVKGLTPLKLLSEEVEKVYILVQDSVLFTAKKEKRIINQYAIECGEKVNAYLDLQDYGAIWLKDEVNSYAELVKKVRDYISCIAKKDGINAEVFVLPSSTSISVKSDLPITKFESISDLSLMYIAGIISLYDRLKEEPPEEGIIVDNTLSEPHLATLTSTVSRDLASIISVISEKPIKVDFYSYVPASLDKYILTNPFTEEMPRIRQVNVTDTALKIAYNTLKLSSPLALVYSLFEYRGREVKGLDVKIKYEERKLRIEYKCENDADSVYLSILLSAIYQLCVSSSCEIPVRFSFLKKLNDKVYKSFSDTSYKIIDQELGILYDKVKEKIRELREEIMLDELYGNQRVAKDIYDKRGEAALHAGLLRDEVKIKVEVENGEVKEIYLSYKDWQKVKEVFSY
ncbi:hypothetical protein BFU36_12380 [Sulfolobus sp. A20]|nr:hypothetical protein BFU36_12380 [Sulfolobus sp. A20]TRM88480.1 hypothetical protein DJ521_01770 [Sulfolobus sp. E3]TRN01748.1 hypothetical protein DJ527_05100 [Sulfolobus sp. F1]TRN03984.1 hypothetical protein DJ530_02100 [Sulfolobus sp. E1]